MGRRMIQLRRRLSTCWICAFFLIESMWCQIIPYAFSHARSNAHRSASVIISVLRCILPSSIEANLLGCGVEYAVSLQIISIGHESLYSRR